MFPSPLALDAVPNADILEGTLVINANGTYGYPLASFLCALDRL